MPLFKYLKDSSYPDRYNREKKWVKILPVEGRPLQTAELIEIQSISQDNIKQGLNVLFENGSVLKGLKLSKLKDASNADNVKISCSEGQLYVEGVVLDVSSTIITVSATGEYNIGVLVEENIITEIEDSSLRNPSQYGFQYGTEGASRLVWSASIVVNDNNSFVIGRVIDGNVIQKELNPFKQVENLVAPYTYERSGNFCVRGLDIEVQEVTDRSVSDNQRYLTIKEKVESIETDVKNSLAIAAEAQSNLESARIVLNNSIEEVRLSPSISNQLKLANAQDAFTKLETSYNEKAKEVIAENILLDEFKKELAKSESLLTNKVFFILNPGIAYVEGFRVSKNVPTKIAVPKNLELGTVEGATFSYLGQLGATQRVISTSINADFSVLTSQQSFLKIEVRNLIYNSSSLTIEAQFILSGQSSISEFLDFIILELNKNPESGISASASFSSPNQPNLDSTKLKEILKSNLTVVRKDLNILLFQSTSFISQNNQIQVKTTVDKKIIVPGSTSSLTVDLESTNLSGAGITNTFQLGFRPVSNVLNLVAEVEENLRPLVRGIAGTTDKLGDDSIIKITKVIQGSTTYIEGIDYQLINQSQIDWSLAGQEPTPGTTYFVSFLYTEPFIIDKDFKLSKETDSIVFLNRTPAPNQRFYVTYTYFLSKSGTFFLNKEGELNYVLSESSQNPIAPSAPKDTLELGSFEISQVGASVSKKTCQQNSFKDLNLWINKVKENSLEIERLKQVVTLKQYIQNSIAKEAVGFNTHSFKDFSTIDLNSNFNACLNPGIEGISSSYTHKDVPLKYLSGGQAHKNWNLNNLFISLASTEKTLISQNRSTSSKKIVSSSLNKKGRLLVSQTFSFLNKDLTLLSSCDALSRRTSFVARTSSNVPLIIQNISQNLKTNFQVLASKITKSFQFLSPIKTNPLAILDPVSKVNPVSFTLRLKAEFLKPASDGYYLYVNNKVINNFSRLNGTPFSIRYPSGLKAKLDGTIEVEFDFPVAEGIGTHLIELKGEEGYCSNQVYIFNNLLNQTVISSTANWTSLPINTEGNQIPLDTVENTASTSNFYHLLPSIAQTFEVSNFVIISAIKLKIKTISLNKPLNVTLHRYTNNNFSPNLEAFGKASTYFPDLTSADWTTFVLEHPVLLEPNSKYLIALDSEDSDYEIFTGEIGIPDLITGTLVGDQIYQNGELLQSFDRFSFTEDKFQDLSYQVNQLEFNTSSVTVDLGSYGIPDNLNNISHFSLNTRNIIPPNTSIKFEFQTESQGWTAFNPNTIVCFNSSSNTFDLRATLNSTDSKVSPLLWLQGSSVSLYQSKNTASFTSQQEIFPAYKNLSILIEYLKPIGSTLNVFYSPTDGNPSQGQEWFSVPLISESDIDAGLEIKEARFSLTDLPDYAFLLEPRTKFRYKVETSSLSNTDHPTILNIRFFVW